LGHSTFSPVPTHSAQCIVKVRSLPQITLRIWTKLRSFDRGTLRNFRQCYSGVSSGFPRPALPSFVSKSSAIVLSQCPELPLYLIIARLVLKAEYPVCMQYCHRSGVSQSGTSLKGPHISLDIQKGVFTLLTIVTLSDILLMDTQT